METDNTLEKDLRMTVQLNHTIVWCTDQQRSAAFLTELLGLPPATRYGTVPRGRGRNGVSLDYHETAGEIAAQHYAFLVSEQEFDEIFGRITERGIDYWADPMQQQPGEINHHDGGRGVYFADPDGHLLEVDHPAVRQRRLTRAFSTDGRRRP